MAATDPGQGRARPPRRLSRLGRLFRDLLERLLGRYREGPEPPPRIAEEARFFRSLAREAPTEEEWEAFAAGLADRAYRDGFTRGIEWLERSWDLRPADHERRLELEARAAEHLLVDPAVLADPMSARKMHEFQELISRARAAGIDVHLERPPPRGGRIT